MQTIIKEGKIQMNTQYEKNSLYIARQNYRMRRREVELKSKLTIFLASLAVLYAGVIVLFSSISV